MPKKSKKIVQKPSNNLFEQTFPTFLPFIKRHKVLCAVACALLMLGFAYGAVQYKNYLEKFSDRDYTTVSNEVELIFKTLGGTNVAKNEYCGYGTSGVYDFSEELYCTIEIATYVPYENDEKAVLVAKEVEKNMQKLGSVSSYFSVFYDKPNNNSSVLVTTLKKPLPKVQCNMDISSNERAKRAIHYLPEKTDDNLIALQFSCHPDSREQYFPLKY